MLHTSKNDILSIELEQRRLSFPKPTFLLRNLGGEIAAFFVHVDDVRSPTGTVFFVDDDFPLELLLQRRFCEYLRQDRRQSPV